MAYRRGETDEPSNATVVRPEYAALAHEFGVLAMQFGHRIDATLRDDVVRLASTIECVDRHVDDVRDHAHRTALWHAVLEVLSRGAERRTDDLADGLADELVSATLDLREVAVRRDVLPRIVRIVAKEITASESMRRTSRLGVYVASVVREGHLTTALVLVVAGDACGAAFRRFFFRLGGPANLIDKLKDARDDHARGEIAVAPGLLLHARLALAVLLRLPALLASHPRWPRVIRLGLRYLGPLAALRHEADL